MKFFVGLVLAGCAWPKPVQAQRLDSTRLLAPSPRVTSDTAGPHPELKAPLSPGRAFAYSFLAPGYAQNVLNRPRGAALFIAFEAVCFTMLRQAQFDLRQARNAGADSVVDSWWNPVTGQLGRVAHASPYDSDLVGSRRAHVEDWVAVLIANHLFAGLDAYVAANLWDLPAELSVQPSGSGASLNLKLRLP